MYAILGIGAAVPMIHLSILEYNHQQLLAAGGINAANVDTYSSASSYIYYVLMGVSYLSGLYIYTKRCPEKYKPGDLFSFFVLNLYLILNYHCQDTLITVVLVIKSGMFP